MREGLEQRSRWVRVALAASCVAALAACGGGSSGVSAEEYASSACTSVGVWKEKLADGSQVLAERLGTVRTLREARRELVRFFDGAIRETDVMLAEVGALEPAGVEGGEEAHAALVDALDRFKPILVTTRAKARQLPLDDQLAFTTGAQSIGASYQAEADRLGSTVGTSIASVEAPELEAAFADDPACQGL